MLTGIATEGKGGASGPSRWGFRGCSGAHHTRPRALGFSILGVLNARLWTWAMVEENVLDTSPGLC